MATSRTELPQGNLKDRIAALQQRNNAETSHAPPSFKSETGAPVSPPRGSLRDKIAKFERKGGVPVPRGSFGMGAPPPEEGGSTKSRELYGNRVAALGKGRPGAVSQLSQGRSVTTPTPGSSPIRKHGPTPSMSLVKTARSPQDDEIDALQPLSPDITGASAISSLPSRRDSYAFPIRQPSFVETPGQGNDSPFTPTIESRPSPEATQSADGVEVQDGRAPTLAEVAEPQGSETVADEPAPVPTPPTDDSTAAVPLDAIPVAEVTVSEQLPVTPPPTEAPISKSAPVADVKASGSNSLLKVETVVRNSLLPSSSASSPVASSPATPSVSTHANSSVDGLHGLTIDTSDAQILTGVRTIISPTDSKPTPVSRSISAVATPATSIPPLPPTPQFDEPIYSQNAGRKSFTAVVHAKNSESHTEPKSGSMSRSSTVTSRPSSSSAKGGNDPHSHHVRSKRQFKHLSNQALDPPASPGTADLAALLKEAAWLEQRLADGNTTFDATAKDETESDTEAETDRGVTPVAGRLSKSTPAFETPARPQPGAVRKPALQPSISFTTEPAPKLDFNPVFSSVSTPTLQVHAPAGAEDLPPTPPPKSARTRRYFSLRSALRTNSRQSISSEMSSDDSAPVATPPSPSPTFELGVTPPSYVRGDSMSVRSGWSGKSGKSGKSESAPGTLRLSPRRGVARATSFAERLLNRASKTRSMFDDDDTIPEQSPSLPSPVPETPHSLLSISTSSSNATSPSNTTMSFDRDIFDAFPSVPQDMPSRPPSYMFPMPATPPAKSEHIRAATMPARSMPQVKTSHPDASELDLSWLQQGSDEADAWLRLQSGREL